MAFIEPRLIHLLNDSTTPQLARADLPPLRLAYSRPSERPFPLEPDTSHREDKTKAPSLATSHGAPLAASRGVDDGFSGRELRKDDDVSADRGPVSSTTYMQLRLLVGDDRDTGDSSFSLSRILDEVPDNKDDNSTKKRHRTLTTKDDFDFPQLPQPVKKQKPIQPQVMPAMPPIINGLHEPPPDAALFPPIAPNDFNEHESNQLKPLRDYVPVTDEKETEKPGEVDSTPAKASKSAGGKTRKKAMKPRRKWSEAETNHLLLGVNRHGVGKWTDILADPDFNFNDRTAGDLKDRFRTCCPNELRRANSEAKTGSAPAPPTTPTEPKAKAKTGLLSENILIAQEEPPVGEQPLAAQIDIDGIPKAKKSRAHRKKLEDLAELGIHGPFKKSHRRERRPFTDQDDKQILEGLDKYGPAWTKIQRDPRFSLSGRQPTDLRDRVRNKYPSVYQKIEKGLFQIKDGRGGDTLEPTVSMSINNTLQPNRPPPMEAALNRTNSKEDLPRWPLSLLDNGESTTAQQAFDFGETTTAAFMGSAGEMDISRLLLDDTQVANLPMRQYAPDTAPEPLSP
ncbi:myb dna-binding domain containing protein [Colletotrichum plurivorum]|uniref:Myb dna-binding domain containing protein n=1 Tax=Colletotrichum plurivorum TaxID=2175906 RepID=A0A8H6NLN3_9PEZI|nr:myb dna-binding domain containing protein [Colletotrichum plurivorum]